MQNIFGEELTQQEIERRELLAKDLYRERTSELKIIAIMMFNRAKEKSDARVFRDRTDTEEMKKAINECLFFRSPESMQLINDDEFDDMPEIKKAADNLPYCLDLNFN
jgi:hypothetical protein